MKRIFIILSVLCISYSCKQTVDVKPDGSGLFQRYYGNGLDVDTRFPEGRSLCVSADKGLISISTVTVDGSADSLNSYFFKTDKNGIIAHEALSGETVNNQAVDIAAVGDGNYYILLNEPGNNPGKIVVKKVNDNLEIQATTAYLFPFVNTSYGGNAITFSAGKIIILGNYTSGGFIKMFLAQLDEAGNTIRTDKVADTNLDNPVGKTVIAGENDKFYWCGNDLKQGSEVTKPRFISMDNIGNIKISSSIDIPGGGKHDISEMIQSNDKGFMMVGSIVNGTTSAIRIIRLNSAGEYQWHKDLPDPSNNGFNTGVSVCEADDGKYVVAGMIATSREQQVEEDIYLACYDNSVGKVTWEKTYVNPGDDKVSKVVRVDGGYALIGSAFRTNTRLITIIRTDLAGNLISN